MIETKKKGEYILLAGAGLLIFIVIFTILILTGVITPAIFPSTGEVLDVNPLSSTLLTFLMLIVLLYVSTRILDFGLKYRKIETEANE